MYLTTSVVAAQLEGPCAKLHISDTYMHAAIYRWQIYAYGRHICCMLLYMCSHPLICCMLLYMHAHPLLYVYAHPPRGPLRHATASGSSRCCCCRSLPLLLLLDLLQQRLFRRACQQTSAYVSIRQHTPAYVSIRQLPRTPPALVDTLDAIK